MHGLYYVIFFLQGFRKIDPEQWEFANEDFLRGNKHLLKNIYRRKPIHSHSMQTLNPLTDMEKQLYEEAIKRLQQENSLLQSELQIHRTDNQGNLVFLRKQLHDMQTKQTQLVSFLLDMIKNPDFVSQQSYILPSKRRRLLEIDQLLDHDDTKVENDGSGSLNVWQSFIHGVGDRTAAVEDKNVNAWSSRSPPSSISSKDNRSSPELSPTASSVFYPNMEIGVKCEPCMKNIEVEELTEQIKDKILGVSSDMNDVFWEQFLTEMPHRPSDDSQEAELERRYRDVNKVVSFGKSWWNLLE